MGGSSKRATLVKRAGLGLLAVALLVIPLFSSDFTMTMIIRYMYYGLLTISFGFLAGELGLFSLMTPVSLTLTGYTIGLCQTKFDIPFIPSIFLAFLVSMSFAALCGWMADRSQGVSFLMLTLVFSQLVYSLALQWTSMTNGTTGLLGIRFPDALEIFSENTKVNHYYWTLLIFGLTIFLVYRLITSSYGLRLRGIKNSETRMAALGYHTGLLKWSAFMVSSLISSIAGVLFVYNTGMINPEIMTLNSSNQALISSILGGVDSVLLGSIVGTVINRTLELTLGSLTRRYATIVGALFLAIILLMPEGLISIAKKLVYGKDGRPGRPVGGTVQGQSAEAGDGAGGTGAGLRCVTPGGSPEEALASGGPGDVVSSNDTEGTEENGGKMRR